MKRVAVLLDVLHVSYYTTHLNAYIYHTTSKIIPGNYYIRPPFYCFQLPLRCANPLSCSKDFGYKGINPIFLEKEDERGKTYK